MPQMTVRIPETLDRALDAAATRMRRKRSDIVRLAVESFLGTSEIPQASARKVRHLLGSLDSGIPDLAENHREYLLEALRNER